MCRFLLNQNRDTKQLNSNQLLDLIRSENIIKFHKSINGYAPTPLVKLPALAEKLGVGEIFVKDESHRFDLKAFKCMGASYAIYRVIKKMWEQKFGVLFEVDNLFQPKVLDRLELPVFCSATDGNHGRAVAWFCKLIGQKAIIYLPKNTVKSRIENIKNENADVIIVDGHYDSAVALAESDAARFGYQVIADTSYKGYHEIPGYITAGYSTIFSELPNDLEFDFGCVQSGVGSFAASALLYFKNHPKHSHAKWINVEPTEAACLFDSISDGGMVSSQGNLKTIMAGLNCGTPSEIAWPVIRDGMDAFMSVSDEYAKKAMRKFYYPENSDTKIISGESGAAGLAGLLALLDKDEFKDKLNINNSSRILLFNTEGDTDQDNFCEIVS